MRFQLDKRRLNIYNNDVILVKIKLNTSVNFGSFILKEVQIMFYPLEIFI